MAHTDSPPLTQLSATELARRIAAGDTSSSAVVDQHIRRIEEVEPELNAISVSCFVEARRQAELADESVRRGQPLGPLHGVPVTIKDAYAVRGTISSVGLTNLGNSERAPADAPLVERLRRAGAIIIAKTNVPQLMFCHECNNPLHGRTNNPWNYDRTPGGSSGGEAAIIAAGGSPLGLASDVGGSIRVPAHFCGLAGIKPTSGRLTKAGHFPTLRGMTTISFQPGPLGRTIDDLELALHVLMSNREDFDDDAAPPTTFDSKALDVSQLRIGVFAEHEFWPVAPPIGRALRLASEGLQSQGAKIDSFEPCQFKEAIGCYMGIMSADGGADFRRLLGGSRVDSGLRKTLLLSRLPPALRQPLALVLSACGQPQLSFALRNSGPRSADFAWRLAHYRQTYVQLIRQQLRDQELHAVLMPPHALPAFRHGHSTELLPMGCYAFWANLLEMPAGVVPVCRVQTGETLSKRVTGLDIVERYARAAEIGSEGLPLGVQVVAPHWREDVVLAVMRAIERHVNFQRW